MKTLKVYANSNSHGFACSVTPRKKIPAQFSEYHKIHTTIHKFRQDITDKKKLNRNTEKWDKIGVCLERSPKTTVTHLAFRLGLTFYLKFTLFLKHNFTLHECKHFMEVFVLTCMGRGEFRSLCHWNSQTIFSRLSSNFPIYDIWAVICVRGTRSF